MASLNQMVNDSINGMDDKDLAETAQKVVDDNDYKAGIYHDMIVGILRSYRNWDKPLSPAMRRALQAHLSRNRRIWY